eukprot:4729849-Amphidinium_carterae.1
MRPLRKNLATKTVDDTWCHFPATRCRIPCKEKGFILVYYRGRNDAWVGYGGAVLYTRSATVPEEIVPRVDAACKLAGVKKLDWAKFQRTDNSCEQLSEELRVLHQIAGHQNK